MTQKLLLVGVMSRLRQGSVTQAVAALMVTVSFLVLHMSAMPFRHAGDNYLGTMTNVSLLGMLLGIVVLQISVLREEVEDYLTRELLERFAFDELALTIALMVVLFASLACAFVFLVARMFEAAREPRIKNEATKAPPELPMAAAQRWHLFLSHLWGTGQDQCATIKRQLCLLLPGVSVFLDIDDLESTNDLEKYIEETHVISIFASNWYFRSKNCLREAHCTVAKQKPIALLHDPVKGGADLETIRGQCPKELLSPIFDGRSIIQWHRIKAFQQVSLKLLTEQLLRGLPGGAGSGAGGNALRLYIPGELPRTRLALPQDLFVYASKHNPGAMDVVDDLSTAMDGAFTPIDQPSAIVPRRASSLLRRAQLRTARRTPAMLSKRISSASTGATHMLLYLNEDTFAGQPGEALAEEVRRVLAAGEPALVMVHENDPARGGCAFGKLFSTTPQDLVKTNLYGPLALALFSGVFWPVSAAAVAKQLLGASEARHRGARTFRTAGAKRSPPSEAAAPQVAAAAISPTSPAEVDMVEVTRNERSTTDPRARSAYLDAKAEGATKEGPGRAVERGTKKKAPPADLGTTTSTDGAQTGSMLAEVSKCTTSSEGVDTTVAVAAEEQAERPKADARPAAAALWPAARRLRTPRGLPVPAEGPGSDKTIQHV